MCASILLHQYFLLAMDDDRTILGLRMLVHNLSHSSSELQQSVAEGVGVARPFCVVKLDHLPLLSVLSKPDCSEKLRNILFVPLLSQNDV